MTEYLAALGCPDPSSLETRTLIAALMPMNNMPSHPFKFMQIEREPTAMIGFSRCPVRTIIVIIYQISRQIIIAEAMESLTKGQMSLKANHDNPFHPSLHQP